LFLRGSKKEAKPIEHYEKFLDLWKDADPGTAEVDINADLSFFFFPF
jgi:hypothetical protein